MTAKKKPIAVKPPTPAELQSVLGPSRVVWTGIFRTLGEIFPRLEQQWKPSETDFGRVCLLRHRQRTLLYLLPEREKVCVAVVLGERAYGLALASSLPDTIKKMLTEARPYAEGRGIRFTVSALGDLPVVRQLVEIKTTPK